MKIEASGIATYKIREGTNFLNRPAKISLRLFMIDQEAGELYIKDNSVIAILNEESPRETIILSHSFSAENQPKRSITLTWFPEKIVLYLDERCVCERRAEDVMI